MRKLFFTSVVLLMAAMTGFAAEKTGKILVISDTHMGDQRSIEGKWGWFDENRPMLIAFLNYVADHADEYSTLVVDGDMFDEWVAPMDESPYVNLDGEESRVESDFFQVLIRDNKTVIDAFRKVKTAGVELVYIPGNHDMTCTEEDFNTYLPGLFTQARDAEGLGAYTPEGWDEVQIEHGHRYDFNNMPNPQSQPGSILPIGYTASKYGATLKYNERQREKDNNSVTNSAPLMSDLDNVLADKNNEVIFNSALQRYGLTGTMTYEEFCDALRNIKKNADEYEKLGNDYEPEDITVDEFNHFVYYATWAVIMIAKPCSSFEELVDVLLTDVKFPEPYEEESYCFWEILPYFKDKPAIYDNLWPQNVWEEHQEINKLGVKIPFVAAVLAGGLDPVLDSMVPIEFFSNPDSNKRIVVFGHTHKGMIQTYDDKEGCIYANTGCWIDKRWCDSEEVTMLTYVELEKTSEKYNVSLKRWGSEIETLNQASINITTSGIKSAATSSADNRKYIDGNSVIIRHDGRAYTTSGIER